MERVTAGGVLEAFLWKASRFHDKVGWRRVCGSGRAACVRGRRAAGAHDASRPALLRCRAPQVLKDIPLYVVTEEKCGLLGTREQAIHLAAEELGQLAN